MSDLSNKNSRPPPSRMMKGNPAGSNGPPDSPNSFQGRGSPASGATSVANQYPNHQPAPFNHHHSNQRPYAPRGRYGSGFGGYHGSNNHQGSGFQQNHRKKTERPPCVPAITAFMMDTWKDFTAEFEKKKAEKDASAAAEAAKAAAAAEAAKNVATTTPATPTSAPSSARPNQVTSPQLRPQSHRSNHSHQNHKYSHQDNMGGSWTANGSSRNFGDNEDHSNTNSLRRNHRRGGHTVPPTVPSDQPWQRGRLIKKNSPDITPNRNIGPRGSYAAASASPALDVPKSLSSEVLPEQASSAASHPPLTDILKELSMEPPVTNSNGGKQNPAFQQNKTSESTSEPLVAELEKNVTAGTKMALRSKEDDREEEVANSQEQTLRKNSSPTASLPQSPTQVPSKCPPSSPHPPPPPLSATTAILPSQKSIQQRFSNPQQHHPAPRRRAATTQGGASGALSLPVAAATTNTTETCSVASSSFCSLIDQVDAMSNGDQYFSPEQPSSPSNTSANTLVTTPSPPQQPIFDPLAGSTRIPIVPGLDR